MSQGAATILRNVYQFAGILNQASNRDILRWDNVSIHNALNWADYCQDLHQQLKGQAFEKEFNSQLAQMTMLLQPVSCLYLSLDSLKNAKTLLVNTLMNNANFSTPLHKQLQAELSKTNDGAKLMCTIQEQASRQKDAEELHASLLGSPGTVRDDKTRFQAHFLICHLCSVVSTAKKKDRFKNYCHAVCDKLMKSPDGSEILVNLFCVDSGDIDPDKQTWLNLVFDHLLAWLQGQVQKNLYDCPLLKAKLEHVAFGASIHHQLLLIYLDTLSAWAEAFVPELAVPGGFSWRSPTGEDVQALTAHFQHLLSALSSHRDEEGKSLVMRLIRDGVEAGGFTVWRSVATRLLQLLKQG